jgi:hypothetical protein
VLTLVNILKYLVYVEAEDICYPKSKIFQISPENLKLDMGMGLGMGQN